MDNNPSWGKLFVRAGLICLGVKLLDEIFSDKDDTVNYSLRSKKRVVYHGICFGDRLDNRIYEHGYSGKKFDEIIYDDPKPRKEAGKLERKRIRRDRPKYNIHHK